MIIKDNSRIINKEDLILTIENLIEIHLNQKWGLCFPCFN